MKKVEKLFNSAHTKSDTQRMRVSGKDEKEWVKVVLSCPAGQYHGSCLWYWKLQLTVNWSTV